jgi:hypothetical protein
MKNQYFAIIALIISLTAIIEIHFINIEINKLKKEVVILKSSFNKKI